MKIAIFTPNQNPYSETFIHNHKRYLKDEVFYYYGVGENIKLENYPDLFPQSNRIKLKLIQTLQKKPANYIWIKSVLKSLKKNKPDVILIEYGTHAHRLLPLLEKINIPFAVHFHGYDASVKWIIKAHKNYLEVFKRASKVFVVSKVMELKILELGCEKEKLIRNTYGPSPVFEGVKPTFKKQQFIAIGRFVDKKAPYYTILAFHKVVKKFPEAKLIMAGDGMLLNSCKNLIRHLKLEKNIELVGVISPEKYIKYLSESIAFVQHSITAENGDMEGTPLAILEASIAALPVISTFHAGISDVIINGETGLLSNEHDVDAMADNMELLLKDRSKAVRLGESGKNYIKNNFSLERHIKVIQDELKKIKNSDH